MLKNYMNELTVNYFQTLKNIVCGLILLLYASSHFMFLTIPSSQHALQDVVFPFLHARLVYVAAGALELIVGLLCFIYRRSILASVAIWAFIAIVVWYRCSMALLGGELQCNCLGLLGRLMGVSKATEQAIPIITLIILVILNVPWRMIVCRLRGRAAILIYFFCLYATFTCNAHAADGLLIEGTVSAKTYNPVKGTEYRFMSATSHFRALVVGRTCDIEVIQNDLKLWRIHYVYDGKTALLSLPSDGDYYRTKDPTTKTRLAILSNEPIPKFLSYDIFGLCVLWMNFCLPAHVSAGDIGNHSEIPLLWANPRSSLLGYGYRWNFQKTDDKSLLQSVQVIRDTMLDLDSKAEYLRVGLKTLNTVAAINSLNTGLKVRKQQSQGFEIANFVASDFEHTTAQTIARKAELVIKLGENKLFCHPWRVYTTEIEHITPMKSVTISLPSITDNLNVIDFRYSEVRNGKI